MQERACFGLVTVLTMHRLVVHKFSYLKYVDVPNSLIVQIIKVCTLAERFDLDVIFADMQEYYVKWALY